MKIRNIAVVSLALLSGTSVLANVNHADFEEYVLAQDLASNESELVDLLIKNSVFNEMNASIYIKTLSNEERVVLLEKLQKLNKTNHVGSVMVVVGE